MPRTLFSETWAELAGTVVVGLLWQGTLIGVLVAVALAATRRRSPNLRYALACVGLLLIAALLPANFAWLATRDTSVSPPATQAAADPSLAPATPEPAFSPSDRSDPPHPSDSSSPDRPARPQLSAAQWYHLCLPWLGRLWAVGIVCFALYDLAGLFALRRLRAKSQAVGEDIAALAMRVKERLGVRVCVQVRWLAGISSALVTGFFRTVILLPASMATRMTPDEIEAILAHEFAHIRRWDLWVNAFQRVVEALLFFHPVVWWLSKTIRAERELCCDELALRAYPDRAQYVRALLTLAETTQQSEALALSSHGGSLVHRVRRILGRNRTEKTKELGRQMSVFLVFVLAAVLLMYGLNSIDAAAQKSSVNVDWLLSVVREKQVQIKSFRSEVTKTVEAPLWESDPGITGRPVEFIYDDYTLSGLMFRVFGRAGDGPNDELGTLDEYWNGTVAIEYDARNRHGKISAKKPRQAFNTPFDGAMLRTTGADYGPYLEDILVGLPPTATEIAEGEYKGMILVESNDHRHRIWLDPARNLLPVRRETYYQQTGPESSDSAATHIAEYTHLLIDDKELLPGLWLPTKWQRIRRIGPPAPEEQWGQVSVIATYEVGKIEVNEEYPDGFFSFSFPPGTEVTDSRTDPPTTLKVGASTAPDRDAALQQIRHAEANLRNAQFKMESQVYQRSPEGELVASDQFSKVEGLIAPGVRARYHVEIEAGVPAVVKREGKMELSTSHDRMEVSFDGTTQTVRSDSLQESRSTTPRSWQGQRGYIALFSNRLTHVLPLYEAMGLSAYLATIPDEAPEWKVVPSDDASRLTVWFPRANYVPEGLQDKMSYLVTLDLTRGGNIVDWRWYLDYDSERPQLMAALEDVRLEQIEGVWLPVHFVQREFRYDPPAAGNSVHEETRTAIEWSHVNAELGPDAFRIVYPALPESYWVLAHLVLPKDWSPTQQREVLESVTDYQQIASTEMGKSRYACRFLIPSREWEQVIEGVRAAGTNVSTYTDEESVSFDERFPKQESWWKDSEGNPVMLEWWNPESVHTPKRIGWLEDRPDTPKKWVWALYGQDDNGGTVVYVRAQTD